MAILRGILQWSLSFLILSIHQLLCLVQDVLEDFQLSISRREVHDSISKLVLQVDLGAFILVKCMQDLLCAHLRSNENRAFLEFVLDVRVNSSKQEVVDHLFLISLGSIVEKAFTKMIDMVDAVLRIFTGFHHIN